MVKSSEVLRLAAEKDFLGEFSAIKSALRDLDASIITNKASSYATELGYQEHNNFYHRCMALCLAAAIAEDAGD